jgi:hypothetical protein
MLTIIAIVGASEPPQWVSYYMQNGSLENQNDYYFGIGVSDKSQKAADNAALEQFARNIDTRVKGEISSSLQEKNGKVDDEFSSSLEISSDVGLKGITITNRFEQEGKYYSLIQYLKTDYNKILQEEIERAIARKRIIFEEEKEKTRLSEERKAELLRKKQEQNEMQKKFANMRKRYKQDLQYKYRDFFSMLPPSKALSFSNGQIIPWNLQLDVKGMINQLSLQDLSLVYRKWLLEFSLDAKFHENHYHQQEARIKYQILPYTGEFYKFSAAFGAAYYLTDLKQSKFIEAEEIISPFIAANLTVPDLKLSVISLYADAAQLNLGLHNYIFYSQFEDRLSFVLEFNLIYNEAIRNCYDDLLVFQPGIRFKTTEKSSVTFSYEENNEWNANLSIGL